MPERVVDLLFCFPILNSFSFFLILNSFACAFDFEFASPLSFDLTT